MRIIVLLTIWCLLISCTPKPPPQEACNFVQNSNLQRVSWKSALPIRLFINNSIPQNYRDAIKEAANVWNTKLNRNMFSIIDDSSTPSYGQDAKSVIYWESDWPESQSSTQARTTIYWLDNQILEADIKINAKDYTYASAANIPLNNIDLESLVVHEFGHTLGLIHIMSPPTVMEPSLGSGQDRREPSSIDIQSLKCEY